MDNSKNVKKAINQSISDINKSIVEEKPCCPYCGSEDIDRISDLTSKDKLIAYYCNDCNEYFISPSTTGNQEKEHQIKSFNNKEERAKESGDETQRHLASLFAQIMNEHDFSHPDEGINFLLQHYEKTRDMMQPKKHRTSPGKMTIKDAEKYIKINQYSKSPCGFLDTFVNVTITYVKAFTDDIESIDTVSFTCDDIVSLQFLWTEFADKNGLYEDCISAFSIDLTEADKRYVDSINKFITEVLLKRILAWDYRTNPPSDKERDEIIKNILDSSYFSNFKSKIIYPHIDTVRDPDTGRKVQTVKRYWGEE